jgi:hypothetical protein
MISLCQRTTFTVQASYDYSKARTFASEAPSTVVVPLEDQGHWAFTLVVGLELVLAVMVS